MSLLLMPFKKIPQLHFVIKCCINSSFCNNIFLKRCRLGPQFWMNDTPRYVILFQGNHKKHHRLFSQLWYIPDRTVLSWRVSKSFGSTDFMLLRNVDRLILSLLNCGMFGLFFVFWSLFYGENHLHALTSHHTYHQYHFHCWRSDRGCRIHNMCVGTGQLL